MIFLDATIVNVALPDIQHDFDAGEQGLQWVVAAYSLTMGMFIMSAATLADRQRPAAGLRRRHASCSSARRPLCGLAPSLVRPEPRPRPAGRRRRHRERRVAGPRRARPSPTRRPKAQGHRHLDRASPPSAWPSVRPSAACSPRRSAGAASSSSTWSSACVGVVLVRALRRRVAATRRRAASTCRGQLLFIVGVGTLTYALIEGPHTGWLSPLILGLLRRLASCSSWCSCVVELHSPRPDDGRAGLPRPRLHRRPSSRSSPCCSRSTGCCSSSRSTSRTSSDYSPERAGVLHAGLHRADDHPGADRRRPRRPRRRPTTHAGSA